MAAYFKAVPRYLPGGTEEEKEKSQSGYSIPGQVSNLVNAPDCPSVGVLHFIMTMTNLVLHFNDAVATA
jgi:hypothetical protein